MSQVTNHERARRELRKRLLALGWSPERVERRVAQLAARQRAARVARAAQQIADGIKPVGSSETHKKQRQQLKRRLLAQGVPEEEVARALEEKRQEQLLERRQAKRGARHWVNPDKLPTGPRRNPHRKPSNTDDGLDALLAVWDEELKEAE